MANIITKITLSEKDVLQLITEKYNLKPNSSISIYSYEGDSREPGFTSITVEGEVYPK